MHARRITTCINYGRHYTPVEIRNRTMGNWAGSRELTRWETVEDLRWKHVEGGGSSPQLPSEHSRVL